MKRLVRSAAEPARAGESVKAEIARAARLLGLTYGRVKRYWYGEIQVPPAHEVDAVRAAVAAREPTSTFRTSLPAQIHVIYDENGRAWPADSPELREGLGYTVGDFDVGGFAVRCLGWVEVLHTPGRIRVRVAPRVAQPKALDALFRVLATSPKVEVVLILRVGQTWEEEVLSSATGAASRIDILTRGPAAEAGSRFVAVRQPLTVLFRDKQRSLIDMLQKVRGLGTGSDLDTVIRVAEADPTGRAGVAVGVMNGATKKRTGWCIGYLARALRIYTDEERRNLVGTDHSKGPDGEYGHWCQQGYDRAEATREPVLEDIRALVFRHNAPPIEARYRRLLVPIYGAGGNTFIVCTTVLKQPLAA